MATSISLSETNFFKSRQIKVYPASFRGSYEANTKFDPESTLTTEYNITRPRIAGDRETYIVSWNAKDRKLACVIGGYYFEISNADANALANKYLCISKRTVDLTDEDGTDSQRTTSVLASFTGNKAALDEMDPNSGYFFTGLLISTSENAGESRLKAFLDNGAVNCAEFIPNIRSGRGNDDSKPTSLVFGDGATATANGSVAIGDHANANGAHSVAFGSSASAAKDNSVAIGSEAQATGASSVAIGNEAKASGEHAVSIGNGTIASGANSHASGFTTTAGGECSQASGNHTTASGVASVAEGHTTTASGECSHAGGKETQAIGACSAAFGDHTVAGHDNQFVIGAFNENDENSLFEIGCGEADAARNTVFKVDKEGNTTLKSLTASSGITAKGTVTFGKDGKETLIVEESQVTVNPQAVFNSNVTTKTLTVNGDLIVTDKLEATKEGSTIKNKLTIEGNKNLVYDAENGNLTIGTHIQKTGTGAVALTSGSDASGDYAFVIGTNNGVSETGSAAFGADNNVKGQYSFASGNGNAVSGHGSVAMGNDNANAKNNAAVFGKGNVANSDGELVIGSFNKQDLSGYPEYFAIGNGADEDNRSTAFKVASTGVGKPTEAYIDDNPIATHVSEDANFKKFLLDSLYPIGSVYIYSSDADLPTITVNGKTQRKCPIADVSKSTWEPIEDYFLYAGDQTLSKGSKEYNALNNNSGSNAARVVQHTHTASGKYYGYPNKTTACTNNPDNTKEKSLLGSFRTGRGEYGRALHAVYNAVPTSDNDVVYDGIVAVQSGYGKHWSPSDEAGTLKEVQLRPYQDQHPDQITINATHCHKMSTDEVIVKVNGVPESQGAADPKNNRANMPQYLCVYAWKRTA